MQEQRLLGYVADLLAPSPHGLGRERRAVDGELGTEHRGREDRARIAAPEVGEPGADRRDVEREDDGA